MLSEDELGFPPTGANLNSKHMH